MEVVLYNFLKNGYYVIDGDVMREILVDFGADERELDEYAAQWDKMTGTDSGYEFRKSTLTHWLIDADFDKVSHIKTFPFNQRSFKESPAKGAEVRLFNEAADHTFAQSTVQQAFIRVIRFLLKKLRQFENEHDHGEAIQKYDDNRHTVYSFQFRIKCPARTEAQVRELEPAELFSCSFAEADSLTAKIEEKKRELEFSDDTFYARASLLSKSGEKIPDWKRKVEDGEIASTENRFPVKLVWHREYKAHSPTPEGVHQDGADVVMVTLMKRQNLERRSGESRLYSLAQEAKLLDRQGSEDARFNTRLLEHNMMHPFETVLFQDRKVKHDNTALVNLDPLKDAFRDAAVIFSREGDGAMSKSLEHKDRVQPHDTGASMTSFPEDNKYDRVLDRRDLPAKRLRVS